ncbi:Ras GTPase [Coemansia spiralis]|uniref:Ras GTPase n=2 Tax=Coemansia TaxID=4863 RepID=A0A9W8GE11_9FUNG|nr:ras family-domain-containing protein [Coemansia spiralis]KAJ1994070.1 Ras GTPase [Coemansia umbellata]KAJ2623630.1 Ras GTPase [Coemansia sp. RSA 1358]KAJ2680300.1 Ras GTPase [Coemansia spiralis]
MSHLLTPEYKIVMLGSGGVGKSMLTTKYINGTFSEEYDPTIEDSYRKQCKVDGQTCMLEILDTAGQEEYAAMRDYQIRSGDCFVIVYSVTDYASYQEAEMIAARIPKIKEMQHVPMVLVGNKCDVVDRDVPTRNGISLARKICSGFYEASARENYNVEKVFEQCVRRIKTYKRLIDPSSGNTTPTMTKDARTTSFKEHGKKETPKKSFYGSKSWIPIRKSSAKAKANSLPDNSHMSMPDYYTSSFVPSANQRSSTHPNSAFANNNTTNDRNSRHLSKRKVTESTSSPIVIKRPSVRASNRGIESGYSIIEVIGGPGTGEVGGLPRVSTHGSRMSLKRTIDSDVQQPTKRRIDHTSLQVVECGSERHVFLDPSSVNVNKALPKPNIQPKLQAPLKHMHKQKPSPNCPIL